MYISITHINLDWSPQINSYAPEDCNKAHSLTEVRVADFTHQHTPMKLSTNKNTASSARAVF